MKNGPAYSHEEKIAIIREHEEGHKTLRQVCEKYGISKSYLCYLLKHYREEGEKIAGAQFHLFHSRSALAAGVAAAGHGEGEFVSPAEG